MKLYMKSLMLLLFLGTVASCNDSFLDQTQTSDLNRETVFADSTYTANFLTGIYTDIGFDINYNRWTYLLANGGGLQSACDEAEFYPSSTIWTNMMFATGTVNPVTVSDDAWSKCYTNISSVQRIPRQYRPITDGTEPESSIHIRSTFLACLVLLHSDETLRWCTYYR